MNYNLKEIGIVFKYIYLFKNTINFPFFSSELPRILVLCVWIFLPFLPEFFPHFAQISGFLFLRGAQRPLAPPPPPPPPASYAYDKNTDKNFLNHAWSTSSCGMKAQISLDFYNLIKVI